MGVTPIMCVSCGEANVTTLDDIKKVTEMSPTEKLLEALCEAIRLRRRYGVATQSVYPTPFSYSTLRYQMPENENDPPRIEMDLVIEGEVMRFDLLLVPVEQHGDVVSVTRKIDM